VAEPVGVESTLWDFHAPLIEPAGVSSRILLIGDCLFGSGSGPGV
jgi:hypothetical protein